MSATIAAAAAKKVRAKPRAKPALTARQRLAIQKRVATVDYRKALGAIEEGLNDPLRIPPNMRAATARALAVILHGGPLFAVACAKAFVGRTWPLGHISPELWAFVDEENARFAKIADDRTVQAWNRPDWPEVQS